MESRLEELEPGEIREEHLSEVVLQFEEQAVGDLGRTLDVTPSGAWAVRRSKVRGVAPRGTEELRTKYKLMSVHWEMIECKKKETPCLEDHVSSAWTDVIDYLLGEEAWLLRARDSNGQKTVAPSWATLLGYEHEIRIFTYKQINLHRKTLVQALALAMNDVRTYPLTQDRDTVKVQERGLGEADHDVVMAEPCTKTLVKKPVKKEHQKNTKPKGGPDDGTLSAS